MENRSESYEWVVDVDSRIAGDTSPKEYANEGDEYLDDALRMDDLVFFPKEHTSDQGE